MFDHVGKNLDEEAAKRSAQSVLMTMVLFGALGAGLFAYTAWKVTEAVIGPILDDDVMVQVELDEPEEEELEAPAPPPPPLAAEPEPEEEEEEEEEPDPDEEPEPDEMQDPQELDKEVKTEIKETKAAAGSPDGHAQGQEGGKVGGDPDSDCLDCTGTAHGGPKKIHKTDIQYKKPCRGDFFKYPKAAEDLGLGPVRCIARVYIGADGAPYDVVPDKSKCPVAFHEATKAGIFKCSWYPYKSPGTREKIPVQTMLGVTFNPPR